MSKLLFINILICTDNGWILLEKYRRPPFWGKWALPRSVFFEKYQRLHEDIEEKLMHSIKEDIPFRMSLKNLVYFRLEDDPYELTMAFVLPNIIQVCTASNYQWYRLEDQKCKRLGFSHSNIVSSWREEFSQYKKNI